MWQAYMILHRNFPSITTVRFMQTVLTLPKGFIGLSPESLLSCGVGALLLQLALVEAVALGSQAESQFKSSGCCNPSSTGGIA